MAMHAVSSMVRLTVDAHVLRFYSRHGGGKSGKEEESYRER
jgi:hypothetical protein